MFDYNTNRTTILHQATDLGALTDGDDLANIGRNFEALMYAQRQRRGAYS